MWCSQGVRSRWTPIPRTLLLPQLLCPSSKCASALRMHDHVCACMTMCGHDCGCARTWPHVRTWVHTSDVFALVCARACMGVCPGWANVQRMNDQRLCQEQDVPLGTGIFFFAWGTSPSAVGYSQLPSVAGQPPSAVVPVPFLLGPWWTPLYGTIFLFLAFRGHPGQELTEAGVHVAPETLERTRS